MKSFAILESVLGTVLGRWLLNFKDRNQQRYGRGEIQLEQFHRITSIRRVSELEATMRRANSLDSMVMGLP